MEQRTATMHEPLRVFLKTVSLFSALSDAEIDLLAQVAREVDYPRNSQIVRQGDPGGSLLIVRTGEVKVLLERPAGKAVDISTFRPGDFFGEMSLFDRKPRSATATAVADSRIVEIGGEAFTSAIAKNPEMALSVLAEIASRVRRTDETIVELADEVYREAYSAVKANAEALVKFELDSIKTIYQKTEERASQTLQRAAQTVDEVEKLWSFVMRWAIPAAGIALLFLTSFGVYSFYDVMKKREEVNEWHDQIAEEAKDVERMHAQIDFADKRFRILRETMTELRGIRESAGLGGRIETADDLKRVAINYDHARNDVYTRYIDALGSSPQSNFEPEVVLEAVDTYVTLARGGRSDRRFIIGKNEDPRKVLDALVYVVKNLRDSDDHRAHWREDKRLRELLHIVGEVVPERQRKMTVQELKTAIAKSRPGRMGNNVALVLADLREKDAKAIEFLTKMAAEDKTPSGWGSALGALGLARLGDEAGWRNITRQLEQKDRAYAAAVLLAQESRCCGIDGGDGDDRLKQLAEKFEQTGGVDSLSAKIKKVIDRRVKCPSGEAGCHPFNNCFEERYAQWLIACLDGNCETFATNELVGGECSLGR